MGTRQDLKPHAPPSIVGRTLCLRSRDNQVFKVDDAFIRESEIIKFLMIRSNHTFAKEVPLPNCDGAAIQLLIKLVDCFKDDPEFIEPINRDQVKSVPNSHPAMKFINGLSTDQFKAVADAAAYLRARRLVDCLVDAVMHRSELKQFYATVKIVD